MERLPENVVRMLRHPGTNKVLSVVSPEGFPHSIVLGAVVVGDDDRIYVGEAYMYRTSQYLEACPKAEFLAWKGKDGYSVRVVAEGRVTEGPEFDRLSDVLGRMNMTVNALWVFRPTKAWDESASDTSGDRVVRWTSSAPVNSAGCCQPSPSYAYASAASYSSRYRSLSGSS